MKNKPTILRKGLFITIITLIWVILAACVGVSEPTPYPIHTTSYSEQMKDEYGVSDGGLEDDGYTDEAPPLPNEEITGTDGLGITDIDDTDNKEQLDLHYPDNYPLTEEYTSIQDDEATAPTETPHGLTEAVVTRVIDGDTVELYSGERVRLIGIDAPEVGEAGADEATNFVRDLV
ncbi:MAG: hypothetical protein FWD97_04240 [Defluviitaleaceae bacterium]|nr:hypothetical protein [Defluviitaleaceae bacterium]